MGWAGDDTPLGWALTLAYVAAAIVTLAASRGIDPRGLRRFVIASGIALAVLGANKQLDLQTFVFRAGRRATFALGLYEHRDALHVLFPFVVGLALALVGWLVARALRAHLRAIAPMLAGWALLAVYVVVRVALFSHLVRVLGWTWLETEASALLEVLAIVVIALGALRARSAQRRAARRS